MDKQRILNKLVDPGMEVTYLIYSGRALDNPQDPESSHDDALKIALDEYLDSRPITTPLTEPVGSDLKILTSV